MNNDDINFMLKYLPRYIKIAKTPDFVWSFNDKNEESIKIETIDLKPIDIIRTFIALQHDALRRIHEEKKGIERKIAIDRIKRMSFFERPREKYDPYNNIPE